MTRKDFLRAVGALALAGGDSPRILSGSEQATPLQQLPSVIRVGIVGFAGHYSEITGGSRSVPNIRFTAISDPDPQTMERVARSAALRSARQFRDYKKMLAAEPLDIVAVCGENATRARILQACAERNVPIISEKPLALTHSELTAVKRTIQRHRVPLSMLLTMRCAPPYLAMREIVQSGRIGGVVSMDAQKSYQIGTRPEWMKSRQTFGGTIPYVGIHMLDLMRWITSREFIQVAAFHSNVGTPEIGEMENNAALILKLDNRGSASLRIDYLRPPTAKTHGDDRLRVVGTRGIVEYQEDGLTLVTDTKPLAAVSPLPPAKSLFVDFVESIYLGKPHIISPADIWRISEIVLKARAAADSNRVLSL